MSIIRVEKNKNYVVMNRTVLNDNRLSWKAKGIMAYMLSMPDDWKFFVNELIKHSSDGEKSFRSGLKELKEYGYVKRVPIRKGNKIVDWETIVTEKPLQNIDNTLLTDSVQVEDKQVRNEYIHKDVLLNIESKLSTNILNNDKDNFPYSDIISYLNEKTRSNYKSTSLKTRELIQARCHEGFNLEEFKTVINKKTVEWLNNKDMCKYLRPETLFGLKFESYLNQKEVKQIGTTISNYEGYNFDKQRECTF